MIVIQDPVLLCLELLEERGSQNPLRAVLASLRKESL